MIGIYEKAAGMDSGLFAFFEFYNCFAVFSIFFKRISISIGFVRKSFIPLARARSLSS